MFVLGAVLVEVRRPRAGAPVLALLALAGLLRPEAWVFSGLYWLYIVGLLPACAPLTATPGRAGPRAAEARPADAAHGRRAR